jgi:diguanylate cyclase (GGDEF)-like protein/PAS domain S-box-containing protein
MKTASPAQGLRPGGGLDQLDPGDGHAREAVEIEVTADADDDPDLAAERIRLVFEDSAIGMAIEDLEGRFLQVNSALCAMIGYTPSQLLGMGYQQVCHPDDCEDPAYLESLRTGAVRRVVRELRYRRADGSDIWVRVHIGVIHDDGGNAKFYTAQIEDISQRHAAEQRFRGAFADAAVGMAVTGKRSGSDEILFDTNAAMGQLLGRAQDELVGRSVTEFAHPADVWAVRELFASLRLGTRSQEAVDVRCIRPDGTFVWVHLSASVSEKPEGSAEHLVIHLQDVTARKLAEARLIHQAEHDVLTGLPNRVALAKRIAASLDRGQHPALLFVDLDRFKQVNDTLGHATGDKVLTAVASRLRDAIRDDDVVARIGGDEFVVLAVSATSPGDAERVAERLHAVLATPFQVEERSLYLTASIGIALPGVQVRTAEDALRAADIAMYQAKTSGTARTATFDVSMSGATETRLTVERDLHRAIATPDELGVWFQPVVSVASGRVVGVEALARWHHPERGLVLPEEFLPVAEETGLISPIGRIVLAAALDQGRRWRDEGLRVVISVNLSRRQLADPGLEDEIAGALTRAAFDPADLCLEVTESVIVDAASRGARTVQRLRTLGIAVAIDDFAEGYSSLSYLRNHPMDVVKIDQSFIAALESSPRDAAIVGGIIELAHALSMTCVAEGVERPTQLRRLGDLGCDQVQGFLLGRPRPADLLTPLLRRGGLRTTPPAPGQKRPTIRSRRGLPSGSNRKR